MGGDRASRIAPLAALLAALFFALYAWRLAPDLSLLGDSAELVTAAALWGVPHPPGYPLFTLVGHLFASIPSHSLPWRVHLTSAVFHAGAVAATVIATFTITKSRVAAMAAGFALGIARSFLLGSLYAEVFALNDMFTACLFALALRIRRHATSRARNALLGFAFCAGLAFAHHMMFVLAAPALAILIARPMLASSDTDARRWLELFAAFALPVLLAIALIALSATQRPELSWGEVHDVRSLWHLVTRGDYGGLLSPARRTSVEPGLARVHAFAGLLVASLGEVTLLGAAIGVFDRLVRSPVIGVSLLLAIALSGPIFAWANAIDTSSEEALAYVERFTTMCHVPLAIAFGVGVASTQTALGSNRGSHMAAALALLGWCALGVWRAGDVDLHENRRGLAFAHDLLLFSPERSLLLLSGDGPSDAALYVCAVEQRCGDRIVLSPGTLSMPWKMAQIRRKHPEIEIPWSSGPALHRTDELVSSELGRRPVLVSPELFDKDPDLNGFERSPAGLLLRIWPARPKEADRRDAFLSSARAMAGGDCEGCGAALSMAPHPSQDVQIARAYEAAYLNHARTASLLGEGELARLLEARAREADEKIEGR
ncbi:MAG TPA: DUF2723 domain-containing protein [Polyangiaceae bacterium]|jgi:hypothetical protein|nr:DUF2723 domain-containing protein [Polyangiaceae bacterium]